MEPSLLQFYISRQWLNKFKTFAEPGPISNNDFLCIHGGKECCYVNSGRGSLLNPLQINKEPWISSPHIPIWTWVYLIPYGSEIGPVWNLTLELRMPETVPCCESFNFELELDTWVANYGRVSPPGRAVPGQCGSYLSLSWIDGFLECEAWLGFVICNVRLCDGCAVTVCSCRNKDLSVDALWSETCCC